MSKVTMTVPLGPVTVTIATDSELCRDELLMTFRQRFGLDQVTVVGSIISLTVPSDCVQLVEEILERESTRLSFKLETTDGSKVKIVSASDASTMFEITGARFLDPYIAIRFHFRAKKQDGGYLSNEMADPLCQQAKTFLEREMKPNPHIITLAPGFVVLVRPERQQEVLQLITLFASAHACQAEILDFKDLQSYQ